jgi:hypothetical protein
MFSRQALRLARMENMRQTPTRLSIASRLLSTFESAGLAMTATFAGVLWIGLALPGLPLLPGVGGGQNSNVAISLSSAVLGVQDTRTFAPSAGASGRQARLLALLLPSSDSLGKELATRGPKGAAPLDAPLVITLPPAAHPTHNPLPAGPRVIESTQLASAAPAPARPSPPPPAPPAPRPPAPAPTPPRQPDPTPQAPEPPVGPAAPPTDPEAPAAGPQPPAAGDTPPSDAGTPVTDPAAKPGTGNNGNGNGNGNENAGGNNPNAGGANAGGNGNGNGSTGGSNPNAGGANAGGNGNGAGNGAPKGTPKKGP